MKPKRLGPEWWALYAAAFVKHYTRHVDSYGLDDALARSTCFAKLAAQGADVGLVGFCAALKTGAIESERDDDE